MGEAQAEVDLRTGQLRGAGPVLLARGVQVPWQELAVELPLPFGVPVSTPATATAHTMISLVLATVTVVLPRDRFVQVQTDVDDAGLHQILVRVGQRVEALFVLHVLDLLDDD